MFLSEMTLFYIPYKYVRNRLYFLKLYCYRIFPLLENSIFVQKNRLHYTYQEKHTGHFVDFATTNSENSRANPHNKHIL